MNLYCILGPTSSGKTDLSLKLASQLEDCWIVNCDARQVYKYLNIGTGKIIGQWQTTRRNGEKLDYYLAGGQKHLLIDYIHPQAIQNGYSLVKFLFDYKIIIERIKPKNIVLVGGTGWYARSIYKSIDIQQVLPNCQASYNSVKTTLRQKKLVDLWLIYGILGLQNTCFKNAQPINHSDWNNPIRMQNHILTNITQLKNWQQAVSSPVYNNICKLAIIPEYWALRNAISLRLEQRIDEGLVEEVQYLQQLLESDDFDKLGLEYRLTNRYLLGQLTSEEWRKKLLIENYRYSKRQVTWLQNLSHTDDIKLVDTPQKALQILENLKK